MTVRPFALPKVWGIGSITELLLLLAAAGLAGCGEPDAVNEANFASWTTCSECSLQLQHAWSSSPDDPNTPASAVDYLEVSNSVMTMGGRHHDAVVIYDRASKRSERIAHNGDGPGEFRSITGGLLDHTGDTLVLLGRQRISFMSPDLTKHYRTFSVQFFERPQGMVELRDGTLLFLGPESFADPESPSLHRFTREGESFGSFRPWGDSEVWNFWQTLNLAADSGHVWATRYGTDGFVLEDWNVEERSLVREIKLKPDWWVARGNLASSTQDERRLARTGFQVQPGAAIHDLFDTGDVLLLIMRQAESDWEGLPIDTRLDRIWDTAVVALDRDTGKPLAAYVVDDFLTAFTNTGRVALTNVKGDFDERLTVMLYDVVFDRGGG